LDIFLLTLHACEENAIGRRPLDADPQAFQLGIGFLDFLLQRIGAAVDLSQADIKRCFPVSASTCACRLRTRGLVSDKVLRATLSSPFKVCRRCSSGLSRAFGSPFPA